MYDLNELINRINDIKPSAEVGNPPFVKDAAEFQQKLKNIIEKEIGRTDTLNQ